MDPLTIDTGSAKPVFSKARPLYGEKRAQVEAELTKWEAEGIIVRVDDDVQWASPLHAVKKKDGTWRVCGDFRRLNAITKPDKYPLPSLTSFNENMADCIIFSRIDLRRAYHQCPIAENDQIKTTINSTLGLFKFVRSPYGLKNAGVRFQKNIHKILRRYKFAFTYMDDIIVASRNAAEHLKHLRIIFQALANNNILINEGKCEFGRDSLEFLGHMVDKEGIRIPGSRVEAITRFPRPTTVKELERFLGLCAYVHRFVSHASGITAPLHRLRSCKSTKAFQASWTEEHDRAFKDAKLSVASATLLVHPNPKAKVELWTDASDVAAGAVLVQFTKSAWKPIAFWSKTFNTAQQKYSPFDRELMAVSFAVDHFRYVLESQPVVVRTDHKPLVGALNKVTDSSTPLQRRHLNRIAQYIDKIEYCAGKENILADALSRIVLESAQADDVLPEQDSDAEAEEMKLIDPSVFLVSTVWENLVATVNRLPVSL